MGVDKQRAKDAMARGSASKVDGLTDAKIGVYFNHEGRCLKSNWDELTRALGLSFADRAKLSERLSKLGLSPPKK